MLRTGTIWLLVWVGVNCVGIGLIDLYLYHRWGYPGTITAELRILTRDAPLIVFLVGFLLGLLTGHILWGDGWGALS